MFYYIVTPIGAEERLPQGFDDLYEAILWQDELAMEGVKSDMEMLTSYSAA